MRAATLLILPLAGCFPDLDEVDFSDTGTRDTDDVVVVDTEVADDSDDDSDVGGPRDTAAEVIGADELAAGNVVLTEIHVDPAGCARADGQYLELRNVTGGTVNLRGLRIAYGSSAWTVSPDADLLVPTGDYVVGAVAGATCPYTDALGVDFAIPAGRTVPTSGAVVAVRTPGGTTIDEVDLRAIRLGGTNAVTRQGRALDLDNGAWSMAGKLIVAGGADHGSPGADPKGCFVP